MIRVRTASRDFLGHPVPCAIARSEKSSSINNGPCPSCTYPASQSVNYTHFLHKSSPFHPLPLSARRARASPSCARIIVVVLVHLVLLGPLLGQSLARDKHAEPIVEAPVGILAEILKCVLYCGLAKLHVCHERLAHPVKVGPYVTIRAHVCEHRER